MEEYNEDSLLHTTIYDSTGSTVHIHRWGVNDPITGLQK